MEERAVKPFSKWRHFKGSIAIVIAVAQHSETSEKMVVYYCLKEHDLSNNNDGVYVRPLSMFLSEVDHNKYPNVSQKYRFEKIK